jgi:predicted fused transcriptional regulator/phosphomethylpyrimidine kinase
VTGANEFFLVDNHTVERYQLAEYAHPMFGRSQHCPGILYDANQHAENQQPADNTSMLATVRRAVKSEGTFFSASRRSYTRYKCRIRKPWYKVPSVYSTSIGMLKLP